jgi:hypothetical protein
VYYPSRKLVKLRLWMQKPPVIVVRLAQVGFWLALILWSWLLLKPNPFPETARELDNWGEWATFLAAKTLHASCYAILTLWVWFSWSGRSQKLLFWFVVLHAVLSEVGQYLGNLWFGTLRYGCIRDVLIDWFGVVMAMTARWLWTRQPPGTQ